MIVTEAAASRQQPRTLCVLEVEATGPFPVRVPVAMSGTNCSPWQTELRGRPNSNFGLGQCSITSMGSSVGHPILEQPIVRWFTAKL